MRVAGSCSIAPRKIGPTQEDPMTTVTRPAGEATLPAGASKFTKRLPIRARYDNWIGGEYVAAGQGPVLHQPDADHRPAALRGGPLDPRGRGQGARCRARRGAQLERHLPDLPGQHPQPDRRPAGAEPRGHRADRDASTTASRSARRSTPTCRWRSITSATSPARIRAQEGGHLRDRRATPSPITSTSRSASWARSSPGTSRC